MLLSGMAAPVLVTGPDEDAVDLATMKLQLRLDADDDEEDALIAAMITAATQHFDGWDGILGRCLVTQTWRQDYHAFRGEKLRLPLLPVASIATARYRDEADAEQTLAASLWSGPHVDARGAYLRLNAGQSWPCTYERPDAVSITYVAGYGAAVAVPEPLRQAIRLLAAHWFENREAVNIGNITTELPFAVMALVRPYRRLAF